MAACIWSKASGGFLHWKPGIINVSQSKRHHPILSTPRDMEKASADNVDLTTLEISWMTLKLDWLVVSCFYVMKLLLRIPWCFEKMRAVWDLQRKHHTNTDVFCLLSFLQDFYGLPANRHCGFRKLHRYLNLSQFCSNIWSCVGRGML